MKLRQLLLLLCVALVTGGTLPQAVATAQADVVSPQLEGMVATENDCSFLIKGSDDPRSRLGEISCGTVDVPENWSEPEGRRLQIAYAVLKSTGDNPAPDPVIHLGGGPGISPLSRAESWGQIFSVMRQDHDVILFDQRGTRLSSPLRCEGQSAALNLDAPTDAPPPAYPAEISDPDAILQAARETYDPIVDACIEQVQKSGADLTQYNTIASANDVVALVKALGYDSYNLYGISYGTRLALEVMRSHPDSGLRSVVLDSTYPPEIKSYEQFPQEPHEVVVQLFVDCARDTACNASYPDLKERFVALLAELRSTPVVAEDGTTITDRDLIALMQTLGANIPVVPFVPLMISELEQGNATTYLGITSGSLFAAPEVADGATPTSDEEVVMGDLSPARRFVVAAQESFTAQSEGEEAQFLQLLDDLVRQEHSEQSLRDFVDQAFPDAVQAETRASLQSAIDAMGEADVQEVFAVAEQSITLADLINLGQSVPQYYSVECHERAPFQSFDGMVANAQGLEIPDLALGVPETFVKLFAICAQWPSGEAPASTAEAVWSTIPTLVLAGAYDNLTPVSWNKSAFVSLPNAEFFLVPMAGHGTIAYSECAQLIGQAFVADPNVTPDSACLADLKPQWVLPPTS